jgi:hypothetical protein
MRTDGLTLTPMRLTGWQATELVGLQGITRFGLAKKKVLRFVDSRGEMEVIVGSKSRRRPLISFDLGLSNSLEIILFSSQMFVLLDLDDGVHSGVSR